MPQFDYEALNPSGESITGTLEANSSSDAVSELRKRSLWPTKEPTPSPKQATKRQPQTQTPDIKFNCPECGNHVVVDKRAIGMQLPCPHCSYPLTVPEPSAKCDACGQPVKGTTRPKPIWYDADEVDWYCHSCRATFCGQCSTAKVQKLKTQYRASSVSLKRAIDNDDQALYFAGELDPYCPRCEGTLDVMTSQDT